MPLTVFPVVENQQRIVLIWGRENKLPCGSSALRHRCKNKMCNFWGMVFPHNPLQFLILYSSSPYPSNCSPLCQQEMGYKALPAWGVEEWAGQHSSLAGLLWASSVQCIFKYLIWWGPRWQFSCPGLIGLLEICCLLIGRKGKRAGTGMHRIVTGIPVNALYEELQTTRFGNEQKTKLWHWYKVNEICWKLYLYFMREN